MGTWGAGLYSNDSACDIRGDYIDKLTRGKTNDEATQELINSNRDIMGDVEEEPLFWFALADTQWNYGRLLPKVKEKALYFLSQDKELQRWKESGERQLTSWIKTLDTLKEKLESPQPPEKRCTNIDFTGANGILEMFMHTVFPAITAKKKASMRNIPFSGKYQSILGGPDTLFLLFRFINGLATMFRL